MNTRELVVPLASAEACDPGRFGLKAANLAQLGRAGLPVPGGYCVDAAAYRMQLAALGLEQHARAAFSAPDGAEARRHALALKLGLMDRPIDAGVLAPLLAAWREVTAKRGSRGVVRSSALVEDRAGSSFAGQFESFLDLDGETDFVTAVRACWAALWSTRALRYMATHDLDPADTAMALIVQPLVQAHAAGGGLSRSADDGMLINATRGLGDAIAQGEVAPDRYRLDRDGKLRESRAGRTGHAPGCAQHGIGARIATATGAPCLTPAQAVELGGYLRRAEDLIGVAVEIEWALDERGFKLLQARPLHVEPQAPVADEEWRRHPRLNGHPAGVGWTTGRACVINCECELERVAPGDVLVTRAAGPALSAILPRVAGVVAELGGSTSHLASLARERGIPMVLGVDEATQRIPDGAQVAVDGVAGVVRWMQ